MKDKVSVLTQIGYCLKHTMSVHEGIKYKCDYCEYKAVQKGNLKRHTMSVHEGIKYQCDHYEFKATTQGNFKRHVSS